VKTLWPPRPLTESHESPGYEYIRPELVQTRGRKLRALDGTRPLNSPVATKRSKPSGGSLRNRAGAISHINIKLADGTEGCTD